METPKGERMTCKCGRSVDGFCSGLHNLTNEQYQKLIEDQAMKSLNEQAKPQLLQG